MAESSSSSSGSGSTTSSPSTTPQPVQSTVTSIPQEPTKAYSLGTTDWAKIGKGIEEEIKERKVWLEDYYRDPGFVQAVLFRISIEELVKALPSKEG